MGHEVTQSDMEKSSSSQIMAEAEHSTKCSYLPLHGVKQEHPFFVQPSIQNASRKQEPLAGFQPLEGDSWHI